MRRREGTTENAGDQDLKQISELVGLALQAGRKMSAHKKNA